MGAEHAEPCEVHVERADADRVAAGRRAGGAPEAGQQRPHDQEARPKPVRERGRHFELRDVRAVDAQRPRRNVLHRRAQVREDLLHLTHVKDVGHVVQHHVGRSEERRRERIVAGVLRAADADAAL